MLILSNLIEVYFKICFNFMYEIIQFMHDLFIFLLLLTILTTVYIIKPVQVSKN